jgi:hypothetical protein
LRASELAEAVRAIARSPAVREYKIGITRRPNRRRGQYRSVGYDHYAILYGGLSATRALRLEEELFHLLISDRRSITYRKFRHHRRDLPHRRSLGGPSRTSKPVYALYIAWITS